MPDEAFSPAELETPSALPPLPPEHYRRLVCGDDRFFDINPGTPVFPEVDDQLYESVFDFGCGCGRVARQLMCQTPKPRRYVGVDIHPGMIDWCKENLSSYDPSFRFLHHDVWNLGLGPDNTRQSTASLPVEDGAFSLVIAHSVFTHLYKEQTEFYLSEMARVLRDGGVARTTWFFFDRKTFPMLFDFQVCLYVNEIDPTNAVIYDWTWMRQAVKNAGLSIQLVIPSTVRGHQWQVFLEKRRGTLEDRFPTNGAALQQMCGTGVDSVAEETVEEQSPALVAAPLDPQWTCGPSPAPAILKRHLLRFSSRISEAELQQKASQIPFWYHSYYFDNGFAIRGDYDIGAGVESYGFPESMKGLKILDVGTGAGWFAHYFEQQGAEVTTVDARGYGDFDVYGRYNYPSVADTRKPDRYDETGAPLFDSPVSGGFWIMKEILGSKICFRNARAYEISPQLFAGEKFDLVFLGAVLCHLRDPIGALMAARSVCRHRVMASTPVVIGESEADTLPRQYLPYTKDDKISWWLPNEACFRHWFSAAGFLGIDIGTQVTLHSDVPRFEDGRLTNGEQILRVGSAFVP